MLRLPASIFCLCAFSLCALLLPGCSGMGESMQFHQSEQIITLLDENKQILNHTPPGSYSYTATAPTVSTIDLSIAGITNRDDQDAVLKLFKNHHFDRTRDWDSITVRFYETTLPAPETSAGFHYVNLLRTEKIE